MLIGIRAALGAGSVSPDVVAIEARKHTATGATNGAVPAGAATGAVQAPDAAGPAAPQRSRAAAVTRS